MHIFTVFGINMMKEEKDYELFMRQAARKRKQFLWHEVLVLMEQGLMAVGAVVKVCL